MIHIIIFFVILRPNPQIMYVFEFSGELVLVYGWQEFLSILEERMRKLISDKDPWFGVGKVLQEISEGETLFLSRCA